MKILNTTIAKETEKAYLVNLSADININFWMPKSQVQSISEAEKTVTAADWLVKNIVEAVQKTDYKMSYMQAASKANSFIIK